MLERGRPRRMQVYLVWFAMTPRTRNTLDAWVWICVLLLPAVTLAQVEAQAPVYPEGERFDVGEFHDGLRQRGLTDLLALHLTEHPPTDPVRAALLARDIRLAEFADASRSPAQRRAALAQANRLLEQLINEQPDHERVGEWKMELAASLLYTEAEPYTSSLLYRGGSPVDRDKLAALMDRAVELLATLNASLAEQYDALDDLTAGEYDRLEAAGEVDRIESDLALSEYMLAWARFYRALARSPDDGERVGELQQILDYLENRSNLLHVPHVETHFQAQALLLAGMSRRALGDHRAARTTLAQAIDVVANLLDDGERDALDWVRILARIELARSHLDTDQFREAHQQIEVLRVETQRRAPQDFSLALVVALLDRAAFRAEAEHAARQARPDEAAALRSRAIRSLRTLALANVAYRDEIYAALNDLVDPAAPVETLSGFERCALVAGLLTQANDLLTEIAELRQQGADPLDPRMDRLAERRIETLQRAIEVARPMTNPDFPLSADLRAEAIFNLGVAFHARGHWLDAARYFLRVARDYPAFHRATEAATLAVQLSWEMHRDPHLSTRPEVRQIYLDALTTLSEHHPDSQAGRYWQFFLGQHLAALGRHEQAAAAYARVDADHPQFEEATYLAAESLALSVRELASGPTPRSELNHRADEAVRTARNAERMLAEAAADDSDLSRQHELARLAARACLLSAELYALPGVERWTKALETVEDFEQRFKGQPGLIGRVLRVRMIALDGLGQTDEASQLIPRYLASDPSGAAATLQGLFDTLRDEIDRDRLAGRTEQARARTRSALVIAEGLYELARRQPDLFNTEATYALRLQLAECALQTGDELRAKELFEQCYNEDAARHADAQPRDSRAIRGAAESYYRLGRYENALPLFNRFFHGSERGSRQWWQALLRDLQCRTELGHDPAIIIKSIHQQKFFDSQMGGSDLRREFDILLTTNERRAEAGDAAPAGEGRTR